MSAWKRHRTELLWVGLLSSLPLLLLVDGGKGGKEAGTGSWSTGPDGKRVFFTLAQRLLGDVSRHSPRLDPPPAVGTLCILGPQRYPDAGEWRRLGEWVKAGHTLVFAAHQDDPAVELPFGLRVRTGRAREEAAGKAEPASPPALEVDESLRSQQAGSPIWRSPAWIEGASPEAWVGARRAGRPLIVSQAVGRGTVVVIASDELFDNVRLLARPSALVPFRLLERVRQGPVAFDESLNGAGGTRIFGLLFSPSLRPLTLQLLALAVVFGWAGARVFGPLVSADSAPRRLITEHAAGLGRLCYKSQAGTALIASYLEYFRREVGARADRPAVAGALARGQGLSAAEPASNSRAASTIAELARLRQDVLHPGGKAG